MTIEDRAGIVNQQPLWKDAVPATVAPGEIQPESTGTLAPEYGVDIIEEEIFDPEEVKIPSVPKVSVNGKARKFNGIKPAIGTYASHVDEGMRAREERGDDVAELLEAQRAKVQITNAPIIQTKVGEDASRLAELDKEREQQEG